MRVYSVQYRGRVNYRGIGRDGSFQVCPGVALARCEEGVLVKC